MNDEHQEMNKSKIFSLIRENSITRTRNASSSACVFECHKWVKREMQGDERWLQEWETFNKQD